MLSTAHLATGMVIGTSGFGIAGTVIWAIVMHFVIDMLSHWDKIMPPYTKDMRWAWADMLFGWVLVGALLYMTNFLRWEYVLLACAFSIMPDVFQYAIDRWLPKWKIWQYYTRPHIFMQFDATVFWGTLIQLGVVGLMVFLVLR